VNEVDGALYSRLSGDSTLMALIPGGVWRMVAPEGTTGAYAVFQLVSAEADQRTLGTGGPTISRLLYQVKVIEKGTSAANAKNALDRVNVLLNDYALSLSPDYLLVSRREARIPDTVERFDNEETYQSVGASYRIEVVE
jgi:hypothetical protein